MYNSLDQLDEMDKEDLYMIPSLGIYIYKIDKISFNDISISNSIELQYDIDDETYISSGLCLKFEKCKNKKYVGVFIESLEHPCPLYFIEVEEEDVDTNSGIYISLIPREMEYLYKIINDVFINLCPACHW